MSIRRLGVAAAFVDGAVVPGDVAVDGGIVAAVGISPAGRAGLAVPGFVDLQVNGFAGVDFSHAEAPAVRSALAAMARTGVTACLPTVPTAAPETYPGVLAALGAVIAAPSDGATRPLGVHLEGPFLNPARRGAHRSEWLRPPDPALADRLLSMAPVALATVAPELPGALALVIHLRRRGVVVSVGHSDADAEAARRAFDAGASMVTHLWNAQRPFTARDPGVAGVALTRPDVHVGLIADLVHLAPETLLLSLGAAGSRAVVVTDALDLAGLGTEAGAATAGRARRRPGRVVDGAVRLDDGTLAGAATSLDVALRNVVGLGVGLPVALATVTVAPARVLGRLATGLGRLVRGGRADVVVLDQHAAVDTVLVGGRAVG